MEDDDRPTLAGALHPGKPGDAASLLARESLDSLSRDELDHRIALLEAEIDRVKAHRDRVAAHRLAAEALFGRGSA
jgi:uncharacterized small protein (DUF1192 family)